MTYGPATPRGLIMVAIPRTGISPDSPPIAPDSPPISPDSPPIGGYVPSMNFSDARNSGYAAAIGA